MSGHRDTGVTAADPGATATLDRRDPGPPPRPSPENRENMKPHPKSHRAAVERLDAHILVSTVWLCFIAGLALWLILSTASWN